MIHSNKAKRSIWACRCACEAGLAVGRATPGSIKSAHDNFIYHHPVIRSDTVAIAIALILTAAYRSSDMSHNLLFLTVDNYLERRPNRSSTVRCGNPERLIVPSLSQSLTLAQQEKEAVMTTKEIDVFHKLDRNLLPPIILQADDGFLKREFLKHCTVHIAISSDIELGDSVDPRLSVAQMGDFTRTPFVVTEKHLAEGIIWQLPAYNSVALPGVAVEVYYSVKKTEGDPLTSPVGKYKVKE
jgi:hypothetical protein